MSSTNTNLAGIFFVVVTLLLLLIGPPVAHAFDACGHLRHRQWWTRAKTTSQPHHPTTRIRFVGVHKCSDFSRSPLLPSGAVALQAFDAKRTSYYRSNYQSQTQQQHNRHSPSSSSSTKRSLRLLRIAQSVQSLLSKDAATCDEDAHVNNHLLVQALTSLAQARSQTEVYQAGRRIEQQVQLLPSSNNNNNNNTSVSTRASIRINLAVKERVCRAAALTGLMPLCLSLLDDILTVALAEATVWDDYDNPELFLIPSNATQEAICTSLRKLGRLRQLEEVVIKLGDQLVAAAGECKHPQPLGISLLAFNIFLAALCDPIMAKNKGSPATSSSYSLTKLECLEKASHWLNTSNSEKFLRVKPDEVSYATVLQACAKMGNHSLASLLWDDMIRRGVPQNAIAHNARLQLLLTSTSTTTSRGDRERDEAVLSAWKELASQYRDNNIPDRYTLNLILLPMIRTGNLDQMEALLDQFVASNSQVVVSIAFSAFLSTLITGSPTSSTSSSTGESTGDRSSRGSDTDAGSRGVDLLMYARRMLDTYIMPSLSPVISGNAGAVRLVRPMTQHFNILLEGYHRQIESLVLDPGVRKLRNKRGASDPSISIASSSSSSSSYYDEAWGLYRIMQASQDCRPNEYTVTILTSLCRSSHELSDFLKEVLEQSEVPIKSAVLRAFITAYGRVGDASSACWLYTAFATDTADVRLWNVLLGAFANADAVCCDSPLDLISCNAAKSVPKSVCDVSQHELHRIVNGRTCAEAMPLLLDRADDDAASFPPAPNSQTYCLVASVLQRSKSSAGLAMSLFRNATKAGVPSDGRFINAVLRCFGEDIDNALLAWKNEIRQSCILHENSPQRSPSSRRQQINGINLMAAYHGLLYVSGRALRPQLALRLVYAMRREGLEPDETALNCYHSGKLDRQTLEGDAPNDEYRITRRLRELVNPYESLLYVECTKYDQNDRRRVGERRVRIIV